MVAIGPGSCGFPRELFLVSLVVGHGCGDGEIGIASDENVMQPTSKRVVIVGISDWPLHDLAVRVTAPGVPAGGLRRNLGLLGYTGDAVPFGLPAASARPVDFHRLASRVGTWTYESQAELVDGLSHWAFLVADPCRDKRAL